MFMSISTLASSLRSAQPRSRFAPCACSANARSARPRSRLTSASGSTTVLPAALAALRSCSTAAALARSSSMVRLIACLHSSL